MRDIRPGDFYAVGTIFHVFRFGENVGCQTLFSVDMASGFAFEPLPVKQTPAYYPAETVINYLKGIFRKHGKPAVGVLLSDSAWRSLASLMQDDEIRGRVERLPEYGIDIPGMPQAEAEKIERWLGSQDLRTAWEEARLWEGGAEPPPEARRCAAMA